MPHSSGRRVVGHAGVRWSVRRRRDVGRHHAIYRTALTLVTIVCLVVGASDDDRSSKSSASENTVETIIRPMTSRAVDATDGHFIQSHANDMRIPGITYDAKNEFLSGVEQSVSSSLFISVIIVINT